MNRNLKRNLGYSFVLATSLAVSGCGSTAPKVDVCKKVMQIIGRYADTQLKAIDDPKAVIADASKTVVELRDLAQALPSGAQRDYLNALASDYALALKPDSTMEAVMAMAADLTPTKIMIVCPK